MKIVDIGSAYQIDNDWFFRVLVGPFESKEKADEFAALVALLEPDEVARRGQEAPPPTLGINVSETITTKDKFA